MDSTTIPIVTIDGRYFYRGDERFIARGIVYQLHAKFSRGKRGKLTVPDPLTDQHYAQVLRDVEAFKELNINALWVHHHDPEESHQKCMDLLAANDIYVIFEAASPSIAINRAAPRRSYNEKLLKRFSEVIDSVAKYRNTLGVCVAGQFVNQSNVQLNNNLDEALDVLSRVLRDLKQYMRFMNHDTEQRIIPLCISDGQWSSQNTQVYQHVTHPDIEGRVAGGRVDFYCFCHFDINQDTDRRSDPRHRLDFVKMEDERLPPIDPMDRHKDQAVLPGKDAWTRQMPIHKMMASLDPVPVMISEYGENTLRQRVFDEVRQLYGPKMSSPLMQILSGGFVYEFIEGTNRFGLVAAEADGSLDAMPDYWKFRNAMWRVMGHVDEAGSDNDQ